MTRPLSRTSAAALLLALTVALVACSGGNDTPSSAQPAARPEPTPAPTGDEVPIPTAEQADAAAASEIDESNADDAFDDLVREIDADSDGG